MTRLTPAITALGLAWLAPLATAQAPDPTAAPRPVDLAICLDTSGSMSGLIDAARQNVWAIVNDLALMTPAPKLRVALLTFGNDGHDPARGWVLVDAPLTDDLDLISQRLFALTTNGGTELVGRVVHTAALELDWSQDPGALRILVVAGNESADQDQEVSFRDACAEAIGRDVLVNSIYCGNPADELAPLWREVATRADGAFAAIDQQTGTIVIETPLDGRLAELGTALNATYVPYGSGWLEAQSNQVAQDANAARVNQAAAAQRAVCKATLNYCNSSWDLVDALRTDKVKLEDVDRQQLPEELRALTIDELRAHVAAKADERERIQAQISELRVQRERLVAAEMERRALDGGGSFEFAVRRAVRAQAEAKGFAFPAPAAAAAPATVETGAPTEAPAPITPASSAPAPSGGIQPAGQKLPIGC
ncbi:MAG: VWA domain-containing protein [Planctomycetes bacterium]|nr:VWA domain-containing protein [Planctomycetota bacterium]